MEKLSLKEIAHAVSGKIVAGDENLYITFVSTNSRNVEGNTLFIPIIGERVDAHNFIDQAFERGAVATLTSRGISENYQPNENRAYIQVKDTLLALQDLATYYRNQFDIPIIGITGSVGKTTTKEMIAEVLETKYRVLKTSGNMNSQIGLPLTIFGIEKNHEVAVIEMGMSEIGEMEKLAKIARPTIGVITNIGVSHIGQLKSQDNILKEKLNMINGFNKDNNLYLNGNDSLLAKVNEFYSNATIFSFGTTEACNYKASNIQTINGETHFVYSDKEETQDVILGVLGVHNVYNGLVALAIAKQLNIDLSVAKKGLGQYRPIAMRGQIEDINGIKIIDDTYNASPDSIKGAIEVLLHLDSKGRKIAVLADVLELGEISYDCHYDIGSFVATTKINEVVAIGNEARAIVRSIRDSKANIVANTFTNNENAIAYLKVKLKEGDAVLVKGSRGMHTDEIINALKC